MKNKHIYLQLVALYTIVHHEWVRMFRISIQAFLPSVITTLLYFSIFGAIVGRRIGLVEGLDYSTYIAPGLVMIAVINNAYTNTSSSLFTARFQRSIEEVLISPIHYSLMLFGYILGGILRGVIVAALVLLVSAYFIDIRLEQLPFTFLVVILIACLFSLAGFTNGILAKTFDDVMIVPTFVLSPLTYLGGVFYSIHMLSSFWYHLALFNPIFYMVDLLRYSMVNHPSQHVIPALSVMCALIIGLFSLNLFLVKRGTGIRD
ncbi:MAG: ABC transporter permease [Legionella sp.]|nr:MAG: ABC transporter permease [Legionella sp.]